MDRGREKYWSGRWKEAALPVARRIPGREKFYAIVAYPGASGFLHVGHFRGLTLGDALHRYHRMQGRQVFFPTGVHATGLPAVTFAQKVQQRDPLVVEQLRDAGVPEVNWRELEDPASAARFLGQNYLALFSELGLLVDPTAYFTTIDADYSAFIRWQFARLAERGRLIQAPHFAALCAVCGPVSVDPSETDLSRGGEAEAITYTTVPFALDDGRVLLAATLRPETIYGVTNVWIPRGVSLVTWRYHETTFIVSRTGAERLRAQQGGHIGKPFDSTELVGRKVVVPLAGVPVPVFATDIVNPDVGSGVVMSVPAHAPVDFLAVRELSETDRGRMGPIREILALGSSSDWTGSEKALLAGPGVPAARALRATGATSVGDQDAVDAATERLYRAEFVRGRMTVPALLGLPVPVARERVAADLAHMGSSFELRAFSEPVVCRNGHSVEIHRVPDQWFLRYGMADWKAATHDLVRRMHILPDDYARELPGVIDWFEDRPCTRKGRWLGTPFPLDPSWIIEPIADSTFYPAYFVVRRFVSSGRLHLEDLTEAFFDFVFLGRGTGEPRVARELQDEVRDEFLYWYPLDANIGGKEHKRVHFPVFAFTHADLLPPSLQPKGIMVHWWVTGPQGEKISKKDVSAKGGRIPPIRTAIETWGADALRLFSALAASPFQDVAWDASLAEGAAARVAEVERAVREALLPGDGGTPELEAWLENAMHDIAEAAQHAAGAFEWRDYAQAVYVELPARIRRYLARGGASGPLLQRMGDGAIRLLSPLTPFLAEELGDGRFGSLVAQAPFPRPDDFSRSEVASAQESSLDLLEDDIRTVLRLAENRGERIDGLSLFVAAAWKPTVEAWVRETPAAGGAPVRAIVDRARSHPELSAAIPDIPAYVERFAEEIRSSRPLPSGFRETDFWRRSAGYIARRFDLRQVGVYPEEEGAAADPSNRRGRARPGRPAFFLIGQRGAKPAARPASAHRAPISGNASEAGGPGS